MRHLTLCPRGIYGTTTRWHLHCDTLMYTTHFIANRSLQTAYHDLGSRAPILFVHGFTGSKLDFLNQLAWFSESHRVIAYDQRGHGESTNLGPYTLDELADDLVSFLDALKIPTCHILGHSMGGMVVMRALLSHPERFRSLVLMDTAPHGVTLFDDATRERLVDMVTKNGCQSLIEGMRGQPQPPSIQRGIDFLGKNEHWRRIKVKLQQMDPRAFSHLGKELAHQTDLSAQLTNITVPTTVIVGAHDKLFLKPSRLMANTIEDAKLHVIDNAAHSPQYEHPEAWRAAVDRHLLRTDEQVR